MTNQSPRWYVPLRERRKKAKKDDGFLDRLIEQLETKNAQEASRKMQQASIDEQARHNRAMERQSADPFELATINSLVEYVDRLKKGVYQKDLAELQDIRRALDTAVTGGWEGSAKDFFNRKLDPKSPEGIAYNIIFDFAQNQGAKRFKEKYAGMGATNTKEFDYVLEGLPNATKPKESILKLVSQLENAIDREAKSAEFAKNYRKKTGGLTGIEEAYNDFLSDLEEQQKQKQTEQAEQEKQAAKQAEYDRLTPAYQRQLAREEQEKQARLMPVDNNNPPPTDGNKPSYKSTGLVENLGNPLSHAGSGGSGGFGAIPLKSPEQLGSLKELGKGVKELGKNLAEFTGGAVDSGHKLARGIGKFAKMDIDPEFKPLIPHQYPQKKGQFQIRDAGEIAGDLGIGALGAAGIKAIPAVSKLAQGEKYGKHIARGADALAMGTQAGFKNQSLSEGLLAGGLAGGAGYGIDALKELGKGVGKLLTPKDKATPLIGEYERRQAKYALKPQLEASEEAVNIAKNAETEAQLAQQKQLAELAPKAEQGFADQSLEGLLPEKELAEQLRAEYAPIAKKFGSQYDDMLSQESSLSPQEIFNKTGVTPKGINPESISKINLKGLHNYRSDIGKDLASTQTKSANRVYGDGLNAGQLRASRENLLKQKADADAVVNAIPELGQKYTQLNQEFAKEVGARKSTPFLKKTVEGGQQMETLGQKLVKQQDPRYKTAYDLASPKAQDIAAQSFLSGRGKTAKTRGFTVPELGKVIEKAERSGLEPVQQYLAKQVTPETIQGIKQALAPLPPELKLALNEALSKNDRLKQELGKLDLNEASRSLIGSVEESLIDLAMTPVGQASLGTIRATMKHLDKLGKVVAIANQQEG